MKAIGFWQTLIFIQIASFFIFIAISAAPLPDKGDMANDSSGPLKFYVAKNGSDWNPGSEKRPWRTIQKAASSALPGSTVYVKEGVYKERIIVSVSGNAAAGFVTFQPYPGHRVLVQSPQGKKPENTFGDCLFYISDRNYVCIKGFEIAHTRVNDGSAIRVYGSADHIQIIENRIHDIRGKSAMGITVYGKDGAGITGLVIKGNEIYDCEPAPSEALSLNGNVKNFEIAENVIYDVNNIGIDMIGGEKWLATEVVRDGICRGNTVHGVHSPSGQGYAAGIYVDGGKNIIVERNRIFACDLGLEIGAENKDASAEKIVVRNNLVYNNDKAGIVVGAFEKNRGSVTDCLIINNTIYKNNRVKPQGELWIQYVGQVSVFNNIIYGAPNQRGEVVLLASAGQVTGGKITLDYNLYFAEGKGRSPNLFLIGKDTFSSFEGYKKTLKQDGHSRFTDPIFRDRPENEKGGFYLKPASPARDSGKIHPLQGESDYYGNPRLKGMQVDIGAIEQ